MHIEDQYIQEQFVQNFIQQRPGSIVIYGTGLHTKVLLENLPTDQIVGLMDAAKTGETMYGKKVLSYEEVAAIPDVYIVILARNAVINVIYRRIQEFVTVNHIAVYNISGKRLETDIVNTASKECFQLQEEALRKMITEAEVVSFDIFDTLLCRRVLRPIDVFRLMDENMQTTSYIFSVERMKAESELPVSSNYDIHEIYKQFQKNTKETDERVEYLKQQEIETEKKVLRRREDVCNLLSEAYQQGKKVYLISDMYLPALVISNILKEKGIVDYHKLYVSTNYKTSKTESLFEVVADENKIKVDKWLHIGDNPFGDVYAPNKLGIQTFRLYSTTEMLEESIYAKIVEQNHSLEENLVISYFAAEAYNSPFAGFYENGKLVVKDSKLLTKLIVAPLLMKYVVWLSHLLLENDNDLVLFPSRDGFILQQIYNALKKVSGEYKLPKSIYFYTSRRSVLIAAATNKDDIEYIIECPDSCDISGRISKRFEIDLKEKYELGSIPASLWERLLECSRQERKRYRQYIENVGISSHSRVALVDFVAVGTIQEALQRMTDKEVQGYYFLRRTANNRYTLNLNCMSMYPVAGDFQGESNVYRYYYFLENVLSSYEPSFKRMSAEGKCEFFKESRTERALAQLQVFHEAIMDYCQDVFAIYPSAIGSMKAAVGLYDELMGFFSKDYMDIVPEILQDIINYDEFLGYTVVELNR